VVGASLAGLAAAATLADRFDRVTIVERDTLPRRGNAAQASPRGGTFTSCYPQGRPARWRLINAYFNRLLRVAHRDPVVATAFMEANGMMKP
jgi:phytoene dehydrogenase-like protein